MYEAVVGIDFGSAGSGFAYSLREKDNDNNLLDKWGSIIHGTIYGANVDNKVPTEIILDDNNYTVQFGEECIRYLRRKGLKAGHYFKHIKMQLYDNQTYIKAQNSGRELPLKLIIQRILEKLKELAIDEISKSRTYLKEQKEKIKWVVTVPAIWKENQKSVMMEASINAGLISEDSDKSLFFSLEPEAASLYCSINKEIDRSYFKQGEYYIVCDLGGGTGDIVAHLVGSNNYLNEIHPSCGGKYGSNEIDRLIFEEIIFGLFGCKDFDTFYSKYKRYNNEKSDDAGTLFYDWSELEREIKDFKEGANNKKVEEKDNYPINCSIFQDIFDTDTDLNDLVNEYNDNIYDDELYLSVKKSKRNWIIEFPYKIIYNYINNQANSICEIINDITSQEEIKTLFFVGGYCYNEILIKLIKKGLNKISHFLQPSRPCLSIMEGAVLFGINPSTINIRKAKYTIGKDVRDFWDEEKHSKKGKKVFSEDANKWLCEDCFDKFIEINQNLKYEETITRSCFMAGPRYCTIHFYKTNKPNPTFIFEEGMIHIGKCKLDVGKEYNNYSDREVQVTMKFGGTFIDASAIHLKSGTLAKTKLIYD